MNIDRRKFFQNTGIIAATTAFAPNIIASASRIKKEKLGVALVGLGYYSTNLLAPALQLTKNCELTGIVTGSPDKIPMWQRKYQINEKNIYNYQNFDGIANNSDIDIIYVVLPPSMHAEYTIRAAKAGKHVWCEKPMAPSVIECQSMIKACADNKVKLAIGYRCQHDPNIQSYINVGKQKPFGKVRMKVKDGKFKAYENMEKSLYSNGISKNDLRTGWSLARRIDKYGTDVYWNYFTVDWFSNYNDYIKTSANIPAWDADKNYQNMLKIRDLRETVSIRKVIMLE